MKVIWLQQLEEGIKETYESVGKFAVAKKMSKVPYVGFLGIIGMVTSSVEIVNGIESTLSAGISMYKGKNISVGEEILSSVDIPLKKLNQFLNFLVGFMNFLV